MLHTPVTSAASALAIPPPIDVHPPGPRDLIKFKALSNAPSGLRRTVSTCLASSLSMPETLGLAAQTASNRYIAATIEDAREEVLKGRELSGILPDYNVFPQPLIQMIKVGEMASTLKDDLGTIAEMYDLDVDRKVNTMVSVLSPGIMLFLGAFVTFIAISMILPIYSFLGSIE